MKALKWILGLSFGLLAIIMIGATIFAQFYLEPRLKQEIETRGSLALGAPLILDSVQIGWIPPFRIALRGIKTDLPAPKAEISIEEVELIAHVNADIFQPSAPLGRFELRVQKPRIKATFSGAGSEQEATSNRGKEPESSGPFQPSRDFTASIKIENGDFNVTFDSQPRRLHLSSAQLEFKIPSFREAWSLSFAGQNAMDWDGWKFAFPLKTQMTFRYDGSTLAVSKMGGDIGGLAFTGQGTQELKTLGGAGSSWNLQINVADLAQLPVPPSLLPKGRYSGKVLSKVDAKAGEAGVWTAKGHFQLQDFRAEGDFAFQETKASGAIAANIDAEFEMTDQIRLPKIDMNIDLGNAQILYAKHLNKPKGTPLHLSLVGAGNADRLSLEQASLRFADLSVLARGSLASTPGRSSQIAVGVSRTSLAGWEKYFPALAHSPVSGFVEIKANIDGDLRQPETLDVAIAPLLLQDFRAKVQWSSADRTKSVSGPVAMDARVNLKAKGRELLNANLSAVTELSSLAISIKDVFEKRAGQKLRLDLKAEKKGHQIELRPSSLDFDQNRFQLRGRIQEPQRPKLQLLFEAPQLVFGQLARALPAMRSKIPEGTGRVSGQIQGTYDFKKGIQASPLQMKARFVANIPKYVFTSSDEPKSNASSGPKAGVSPSAPEPLLPNWPVLKNSDFQSEVRIDTFLFNDLAVRGIHAKNSLNKGVLGGSVSIDGIFGGSAEASNLHVDLKQPQPNAGFSSQIKNIDVDAAMTWLSKEWKGLMKGAASGTLRADIAHPSRTDFLEKTTASGDLTLVNAFISTLQFDKMANDALAKIPGVGDSQRVASKGVAADVRMTFEWAKSLATIKNFVFLTPEKNELVAKGVVDLNKNLDLSGTAYLATAPVGGSVREANSDPQGRFMIPLQIKGNLLKPQVSFAQASIEGILKRTAEWELKKARAKVDARIEQEKKKVEKKAEDEVKKAGNKLKKEILKGLFK